MFCSLTKEHKNCAYGIIGIILIIIIVSWIFKFWERRERDFGNQGRGMYERMERQGCWTYRKGQEIDKFQNNNNMNRPYGMMWGQRNKILLPVNIISQVDASKVVLSANSWAKISQAFLENNDWATAYLFVLDNNTEVRVDVVNWKIISSLKNREINTGTGKTTIK